MKALPRLLINYSFANVVVRAYLYYTKSTKQYIYLPLAVVDISYCTTTTTMFNNDNIFILVPGTRFSIPQIYKEETCLAKYCTAKHSCI